MSPSPDIIRHGPIALEHCSPGAASREKKLLFIHSSGHGSLLTADPATICLDCHDDPTGGKAVVHEATMDGGCVDCHSPHSSENKALLVKAEPALCSECHEVVDEGAMHSIIEEDGCQACHDPHSSDNAKLLPGPANGLCGECHDSMVEGSFVHEAVSEGSCTDCRQMTLTKDLLLQFMDERLGVDTTGLDETTELFSSGVIDSVGMVQLIGFVETEGNLTFGPEEITLDHLDSIGRILKFVANRHDE